MATIIDTLIVKLGLDSKDLTAQGTAASKQLQGIEKAGKDTEGSVKKLSDTTQTTSSSVAGLTKSLVALAGILGGLGALRAFVEDTIASSAALSRLSANLGVSVEDISAWGNAVEELGGSSKGLQGTMSMLSQQQTQLRLTGESSLIPYFSALGVAMTDAGGKARPVNQILLDLSERFSHMDRPTANNFAKMLGLDQDTTNLLLKGRGEVELMIKRQKEYNAVTKAQAEESAKLQKSMIDLRQSFTALGRDLLQQAAPAIERFLSVLTGLGNWIKANSEFIGDLAKILGVVAAGLAAIAIASSPITLTVAAVVALAAGIALLWQDFQAWKRGGDSLIDWEKWKPGIDAATNAIKALGKVVKETFGAIFDDVGAVQKIINGDWKGAAAAGRKSDDKVRAALGNAFHAAAGIVKAVPAEHQAFKTANGQNVTSQYAMQYFQDRGMSRAEAAGLASQIHSESNGNASAVGDHGAAYGLIQWHNDRQENFKKMTGHDIQHSTSDEQLAFIVHELMVGTERAAGKRLSGDTDARQAGADASRYYVRPGDVQGEASRRGTYAAQIAGQGASGSQSAGNTDKSMTVTTGDIHVHTTASDMTGTGKDLTNAIKAQFAGQATGGMI